MYIFKKESQNTNGGFIKRFLSLFVDTMICNFFRILILQLIFSLRSKVIFLNFFNEFDKVFPNFEIMQLKDYHLRFITSNLAFKEFMILIFVGSLVGFLYNFICYLLLKNATIGQKILSLKVINNGENKGEEKLNIFQKISKAILISLPLVLFFDMFLLILFNGLEFYRYIPQNSLFMVFSTNFIKFSNPINIVILSLIIILFWLNLYFFSNKFFLHDILTRTRVVDKESAFYKLEQGNNINTIKEKDVVDRIEEFFNFTKKVNKKIFGFIKQIFSKIKKGE